MYGHPWINSSKILYASVSASSNGNNTLVAADANSRIRVLAFSLTMTGTAVTIKFQDGASGTDLTGAMTPLQGQTIVGAFSPVGLLQTSKNTLLNLNLGGAQAVAGYLVYQYVSA